MPPPPPRLDGEDAPRSPLAEALAAPARWLRAAPFLARPAAARPAPALWAAALDAVPDPVIVVDADDRVRAANRGVEDVLGYAPGALVGAGLAETLFPADAEAHRARLGHVAAGAAVDSVPQEVAGADGEALPTDVSIRPVPGPEGLLFGVCLRDARPSRAAQAAFDAAAIRKRVLRTVVDALPDPVVAVDRAGRIVLRNRASSDRLADGPEARGLTPAQWTAADAAMQAGAPVVDHEEPGPDGGVQLTTRIPVRDRAGTVVGLVILSRDVTAQKAEEARLRDEMRAAEAAAQANSELLATTSHEVRTLMNGVTGMTNLLLDTALDAEQQEFVETVQTSSDALLRVINDILDFSKIEAGQLALEDGEFAVGQTVKEAVRMVGQQGAAKGLHLSFDLDAEVPATVRGDAARVRQVLVNLLSNAVKFTAEGAVRVHVAAGTDALTFAVEDSGVGIAPDRLAAVFERFTQADASTARTHGGTGLGLSICQKLVGMMGGELTAESVVDEGSVFRFTLPLAPVAREMPAEAPPPPPTAAPAPEAGTPDDGPADDGPADDPDEAEGAAVLSMDAILPTARVLLAEDNPVNQKVALLTLRRLGYRPDVVADGGKAVMAVRNRPYDVVLMDVMMPVMDGLEATRQIRADPGHHPAPAIVALTANAMEGDRQRCLDAGCDDYLAKPVPPRALAATIERAVRARAADA